MTAEKAGCQMTDANLQNASGNKGEGEPERLRYVIVPPPDAFHSVPPEPEAVPPVPIAAPAAPKAGPMLVIANPPEPKVEEAEYEPELPGYSIMEPLPEPPSEYANVNLHHPVSVPSNAQ